MIRKIPRGQRERSLCYERRDRKLPAPHQTFKRLCVERWSEAAAQKNAMTGSSCSIAMQGGDFCPSNVDYFDLPIHKATIFAHRR
jgi:hypothetical protein